MAKRKRKFAATISTDKIVWDTFVIWARQQNSTASELITKFMEQSVASGEYVKNLYEQRENLESVLRKLIVEELEKRDNFWLEYLENNNILPSSNSNNSKSAINDTDSTDSTDNQPLSKNETNELSFEEAEQLYKFIVQGLKTNLSKYKSYPASTTDGTVDTDKHLKANNTDDNDSSDKQNTAKSRKQEKLYTDRELKERENLSCHQTTIARWRRGKSNMPEYIANNYEIVGTRWLFIGKN
ncbi:MAG: hypothetical protein AAGA80_04750 [Cyanobacteria bacterium P01_F01_bin.143]